MKPATGGTTPFSIPVLIGPKQDAAAPLTLTGTATGLSVSPSTLDFGDIPEVQPSAPQTVTVTNPTGQALPLFVRANGSPSPAGTEGLPLIVSSKTGEECPTENLGGATVFDVPASSHCEVGIEARVKPATGGTTPFSIPVLIGPKQDAAAPLTLTGTATGLSVSPSTLDFGDIPEVQPSAPQTVTVTNPTGQALPLFVRANGSPSPAGTEGLPLIVSSKTGEECPTENLGGATVFDVPASSHCEVGIEARVKPATGGTTPFSIPVLIGPKQDAAAPLTLTGTATGLSVSPSTLDFGDIPEVQPSAPQTVTVTNPTGQALPLFVRANGSPSPAGTEGLPLIVSSKTGEECPTENLGGATVFDVPASSHCEVGIEARVKPATGGTTPFSIPVLIGPKQDAAAPLTLTGTATGLSVSPSTLDFGDIPEVQPSAPQTVTVTNPTGQALPLFVRANGSPSPAGTEGLPLIVSSKTGEECPTENLGGATVFDVPASSHCEVGIEARVKPATGGTTPFSIPVLIGPKQDAAAPLTLTGTATGLSVSPSTLDFGDIPEVQPSAPQTVTVTNPTGQALPLFVRANGSPSPAGTEGLPLIVSSKTGEECPTENLGGATVFDVPASSHCEVGIEARVKPATGGTTPFSIPVLIGPKQDAAAPLTLTGTATGLSVSPSTLDFGDIPEVQPSAPQTVTVTNPTGQALPLFVRANGSPSPAGTEGLPLIVSSKTGEECPTENLGGATVFDVPASSHCEVGIEARVKPATGGTTPFSIPVLIGPKQDAAAPLTLTGTATGLSVSPSTLDFGDIPEYYGAAWVLTALVGAPGENGDTGGAWIFAEP